MIRQLVGTVRAVIDPSGRFERAGKDISTVEMAEVDIAIAQGLFIEMFLTAELVITVLMLAAEKSKATFIAPVGIGLALFVAELGGMKPS